MLADKQKEMSMNSDTRETADQCLREAGAIISCPGCGNYEVWADDREAESNAYARATNKWKGGERGFRGMDREEVIALVKSALDDVNINCPGCGS